MTSIAKLGARPTQGYTLVELLAATVIVMILVSLSLGSLFAVRQRARIAASRSTIRKLHEIVVPIFEAFADRRVPLKLWKLDPTGNPLTDANGKPLPESITERERDRLVKIRRLLIHEMPDTWADIPTDLTSLPAYCQTAPVRAYAARKAALSAAAFDEYGSAECLYMIVARSGIDGDALEKFRDVEIGDFDQDGAPEFWDGWGQPIAFIRWATGYSSFFHNACAARLQGSRTFLLDGNPRSIDRFRAASNIGVWDAERLPTRVWGTGITPEDLARYPEGGTSVATVNASAKPPEITLATDAVQADPGSPANRTLLVLEATSDPLDRRNTNKSGFPLVPLIYSAGTLGAALPDDPSRGYGLVARDAGWSGLGDAALADIFVITVGDRFPGEPLTASLESHRDNVTNHDPFMAGN